MGIDSAFSMFSRARKYCVKSVYIRNVSGLYFEYGDLQSKSRYLVWMQKNTDRKSTEYGHFSHSEVGFVL